MVLALLFAGVWMLVRALGRERARVRGLREQLAIAIVDRQKESRKDALDAKPLPADADEFWVRDEPE
jgi:hypothetical protein